MQVVTARSASDFSASSHCLPDVRSRSELFEQPDELVDDVVDTVLAETAGRTGR